MNSQPEDAAENVGEGSITILGRRIAEGKAENGHQGKVTVWETNRNDPLGIGRFQITEGMPMSAINWTDLGRLLQTLTHLVVAFIRNFGERPFIAIGVKHGNPCGVGVGRNSSEVMRKMMLGDPLAIMGGFIITNFFIDDEVDEIAGQKFDGIVAPGISPKAMEVMQRKGGRCRFLINPALDSLDENCLDTAKRFIYVRGGMLEQENYTYILDLSLAALYGWKLPTEEQKRDLVLAWAVSCTSTSNTLTLAKGGMLIGNGAGRQSRVAAAELAIATAKSSGHDPRGSMAASDSFFPFDDGPKILIDAGIAAILSTSGSVNDKATIKACVAARVPLIMVPDSEGRGFCYHVG